MPATVISCVPATFILGGAKYETNADTYTIVHRVVFSEQPANWDEVKNATGTPAIGDALFEGDPRICRNKTPAMDGSPTQFLVTSEFAVADGAGASEENPLEQLDTLTFDFGSETEEYFDDFSDPPKRATNTNGEPFASNPERTTGSFVITISGNRATANLAQCAQYLRPHAVNSASVTVRGLTIGAGEGKMVGISGGSQAAVVGSQTINYVSMKWSIACAPDWNQVIENRGSYYYPIGSGGKPRDIIMGEPPEKKTSWPLTSNGLPIPDTRTDIQIGKVTLKPYPKRPFNVFGWTP